MFEVTFVKEIKNVEEKFIANLTKRQLVCIVAAVSVCVPAYLYIKPVIGKELCDWFVLIAGLLCGLMGWYKKNGLNFEEYIKILIDYRVLVNQQRLCRFESEAEKEIERMYQKKLEELQGLRKKGREGKG